MCLLEINGSYMGQQGIFEANLLILYNLFTMSHINIVHLFTKFTKTFFAIVSLCNLSTLATMSTLSTLKLIIGSKPIFRGTYKSTLGLRADIGKSVRLRNLELTSQLKTMLLTKVWLSMLKFVFTVCTNDFFLCPN